MQGDPFSPVELEPSDRRVEQNELGEAAQGEHRDDEHDEPDSAVVAARLGSTAVDATAGPVTHRAPSSLTPRPRTRLEHECLAVNSVTASDRSSILRRACAAHHHPVGLRIHYADTSRQTIGPDVRASSRSLLVTPELVATRCRRVRERIVAALRFTIVLRTVAAPAPRCSNRSDHASRRAGVALAADLQHRRPRSAHHRQDPAWFASAKPRARATLRGPLQDRCSEAASG